MCKYQPAHHITLQAWIFAPTPPLNRGNNIMQQAPKVEVPFPFSFSFFFFFNRNCRWLKDTRVNIIVIQILRCHPKFIANYYMSFWRGAEKWPLLKGPFCVPAHLFVGPFPGFDTPFFGWWEETWEMASDVPENRFPRGWAEKERGLRACSRVWRPCTRLHPTLWPGPSRQRSRSMACRAQPIPLMTSWARAALPRVKAPRRWSCSSCESCHGCLFLWGWRLPPSSCSVYTALVFQEKLFNESGSEYDSDKGVWVWWEFGFNACGYHKRVVSHGLKRGVSHGLSDQVRPCLALISPVVAGSSTPG